MSLLSSIKNNRRDYLLLLPFIGILASCLILSFYLARYVIHQEFDAEVKSRKETINVLILNEIHGSIEATEFINQQIATDASSQSFFSKKNRENLLKANWELFQDLKYKFGITHLTFHQLDGTVFLRVHDPKKFGDKILRRSLTEAHISLKPTFGIEGGSDGLYTLRSVLPWFIDKKLVGFIETGRDVSSILDQVAEMTDVHFSLHIDKKFIDKNKYVSETLKHKQEVNWDLIPNEAIVFTTMKSDEIKQSITNASGSFDSVNNFLQLDFLDLNQKKLGHLMLSFNINELLHRTSVVKYWFLTIGLIQLLLSLWYLKFLIRQTENKIDSINSLAHYATLGETSSSITHDISGLLTIIQGHSFMALKKTSPDDPLFQTLTKIGKATDRMIKISEANRKLSSADHKKERTLLNIQSSIDDVQEILAPALVKKNINLIMDVSNFNCELNCNPIQISQVLMNLINNARDAIMDSPEEKWIKVEAKVVQKNFEISVTNSGPLIPPSVRKKLFKVSFTTKTSDKGTGLGLGICKKIIESHDGKIFCSESSEHTQFIIILPIG
jgi:signal transduction histidine kinase